MVSVGFCFGTYLSLVPIIVGDFYGHVNFGIYFGYMQFGSTAATFIIPNIAQVIKQKMVGHLRNSIAMSHSPLPPV